MFNHPSSVCFQRSLMHLESFLRVNEIALDLLAQICHENLITVYQSSLSATQVKAKSRKVSFHSF